jgi:hypothetical protein
MRVQREWSELSVYKCARGDTMIYWHNFYQVNLITRGLECHLKGVGEASCGCNSSELKLLIPGFCENDGRTDGVHQFNINFVVQDI